MSCIVSTWFVSMVGAYTSESTPPATVYQIREVVFRAVPRQSLRARSKWLGAPGAPGAAPPSARARPGHPAEAPARAAVRTSGTAERARSIMGGSSTAKASRPRALPQGGGRRHGDTDAPFTPPQRREVHVPEGEASSGLHAPRTGSI